jgi:hypothetical protein
VTNLGLNGNNVELLIARLVVAEECCGNGLSLFGISSFGACSMGVEELRAI